MLTIAEILLVVDIHIYLVVEVLYVTGIVSVDFINSKDRDSVIE